MKCFTIFVYGLKSFFLNPNLNSLSVAIFLTLFQLYLAFVKDARLVGNAPFYPWNRNSVSKLTIFISNPNFFFLLLETLNDFAYYFGLKIDADKTKVMSNFVL